jgi:hypothetical protein
MRPGPAGKNVNDYAISCSAVMTFGCLTTGSRVVRSEFPTGA